MPTGFPHILLVDDDEDDHLFFSEALSQISPEARLTVVGDGIRMLTLLNQELDTYDVIFLDLHMPRRDGLACLVDLKTDPRFRSIPVVIVSATREDDIREQVFEQGAHHFVCKANNFDQLRSSLEHALRMLEKSPGHPPVRENFFLCGEHSHSEI